MTRWRGRLRRSTVLLIPVLLTSGLLASGCGIAGEPRPRQVEPPPGNYDELIEQPPAPPTEERGGVEVTLYFTRDSVPYAVQRPMETTPSLGELMTSLHRGP